jgi:hypothetical protein
LFLPIASIDALSTAPGSIVQQQVEFHFEVILGGDFKAVKEVQSVDDYTIHMSPPGIHSLREEVITINPILSPAKTQSKLQWFKDLSSDAQAPTIRSATMLACQPPIKDPLMHFYFLNSALIMEECILASHKTY